VSPPPEPATRSVDGESDVQSRPPLEPPARTPDPTTPSAQPWRQTVAAAGAYAACSVARFGLPILGHLSSRFVGAGGNDADLYAWSLTWWPHALWTGTNPFLARVVFAPHGVNLAWVTGIPGLALAMAPITAAFGAVVSSNVLALLAPSLAAFSAFVLCRRLTRAALPSFVAGFAFGFSAYEVAQMRGHLNLVFIFPVPLCVHLVVRRYEDDVSAGRFVALTTVLLAAEFSVSTEIFATMTLFGGVALVAALVVLRAGDRARVLRIAGLLALAYAATAIVASPYLYYAFAREIPPNFHSPAKAASDLLSYIVPRTNTLLGGRAFAPLTRRFTEGVVGDGAYLGLPIMAVMVAAWATHRRRPGARILAATFGVVVICSLGSVLHVGGHAVAPLPWAAVAELPVIQKAIPARFGMYASLIASIGLAWWLAEHRRVVLAWAAALLAVAALAPNVFLPVWHGTAAVPAFFADGLDGRFLRPGEVTMVIPYRSGAGMLWQAEAGMSFRMAGGYVGMKPPAYASSLVVRQLDRNRPEAVAPSALVSFAAAHHVGAVLVDARDEPRWRPYLRVFGIRPVEVGGVAVYRLDAAQSSKPPTNDRTPPSRTSTIRSGMRSRR
jgi:hypothetical protein